MSRNNKFWNKYGLTWKQFQFCLAYLRHFNADQAYREVYDTNGKARSVTNVLKSRKIQEYLRMRMQEAVEAAEVDYNYLLKKLKEKTESQVPEISLDAMRILQTTLSKKAEIEAKLKEIESKEGSKESEKQSINIVFGKYDNETN